MPNNGIWRVYFEQLEEMYQLLEECQCLFSLNQPFNQQGKPSGNYRGVFQLNDQQMKRIEPMLKDGKRLYEVASEDSNRKGLPMNFPKLLDDDSIFKMQIHINKAHLSKNYEADTNIRIASVPTLISENEDKEYMQANIKEFHQVAKTLEAKGFEVLVEQIPNLDMIYIDVKTLCKLYQYQSVQHRVATGRQIRADYFSDDDDGNITKSKLQSIGILLIPLDQSITVLTSYDRKVRTDAIYTKSHPTEIILDDVPEKFLTGRLYRR